MPPQASPSRRCPGRHSARRAPPRRSRFFTALLLLCALSACAESASSPHSAVSGALVVNRRHECAVETLARTAFAEVAQLDALFSASVSGSANASSPTLAVEWTRADACADAGKAADCQHGGLVALVDGKLSLAAPASRAAAAVPMPRADANATTTRLRVHAAFPVNTSATATIALTLPQSAVVVSLSVEGARVRLAAPALNWSVEVAPPCALTSATHVHVVDIEWTRGARWLRWHWDGHLLHEAALPRAHRTRHARPLRVELSLTGGAMGSDARFLVKTLELQRVESGQDAAACRPHVQAPEANCRRHTRFEPRLGADQGYLSLAQVYEFVRSAPARFPSPQFTKLEQIGASTQNRSLLALCVGACWRADAPQVLFTGMHHAREPISMMNLVYTIDLLALDVANGVLDTTALLLSRQLWFVLVVNPDGYARNEELLTWREQRSGQRKNARDGGCVINPEDGGVDLNRNYDVCFAEDDVGSSTDPCGEDFRGPAPFSEPETRAIKQFVERNTSHFAVSLNYHSFGRYFNVPFACKALDTPRGANLSVFEAWAREMTRYNGFQYGQPWKDDNLYSVNGETSDWLWAKHGIFAMSPEVGPAFSTRVDQGFWPPREDVPALAVELHYSNLVAARLAGPQYDIVVSNVTRQLASEDEADGRDAIRALLLLELAVRNEGLATAGNLEIVVTTELTPSNATTEISAFTTTTGVPKAALGTVRDGVDRPPVKHVLAIPEASVVHVVVRDALSCQYIRVTTSRASKNATTAAFQQWAALELPLCGFCGSIGRDATASATPNHDDAVVCKTVADLLDAASLSMARASHLKRVHSSGATGETKGDDATPLTAAPAISAEPTPTETTTSSPPPSETSRAEDLEAPATTKVKTVVTPISQSPSSSPSSSEAPEDRASTSTNTATSTTTTFASFASVPVIATLVLVALLVFAVVARHRRRASERSAKAAAAKPKPKPKPGKRKNYVKVVNDEDEAAQLEQRDDDDEDAEFGRRRNPNAAARARAKSDDDDTLV